MTKYYGYFRISTKVYNYGTDDEEIGDSTVTFNGIFDYEKAQKLLELNYEGLNDVYENIVEIIKTNSEYKVYGAISNNYGFEITEFFDDFEPNRNYMQPVFESAVI